MNQLVNDIRFASIGFRILEVSSSQPLCGGRSMGGWAVGFVGVFLHLSGRR